MRLWVKNSDSPSFTSMGKGAIPVRKVVHAIKRAAMPAMSTLIGRSKSFPVSAQPPTSNTKVSASAPNLITWILLLAPANASPQAKPANYTRNK
jgi:hypothetical protein